VSAGPVLIAELLELVPTLTRRQADHWTRSGWLRATLAPRREGGRGERFWPREEVDVARIMVRLTDAGYITDVAARIARGVVEGVIPDPLRIAIGPQLMLSIGFDSQESRPDGWASTSEVDTLLSRL
jgi:hypothetical protein